MVCTNCGNPLGENAIFCPVCGTPVQVPVVPVFSAQFSQPNTEQAPPAKPVSQAFVFAGDLLEMPMGVPAPQPMCSVCGAPQSPTSRFCNACGTPVGEAVPQPVPAASAEPVYIPEPVPEPEPVYIPESSPELEPAYIPDPMPEPVYIPEPIPTTQSSYASELMPQAAAPVPPVPMFAEPVPEPAPVKKTKSKAGPVRFLKRALTVLLVLVLVIGLGTAAFLSLANFSPKTTGGKVSQVLLNDGTLKLTVEYEAQDLTFTDSDTAQVLIRAENLSPNMARKISGNWKLPMGLGLEKGKEAFSLGTLAPGQVQTASLHLVKQNALKANLLWVILSGAATLVLSALLIWCLVKLSKKQKRLVTQAISGFLAAALLLGGFAPISKAARSKLVYEEGNDNAVALSVSCSASGKHSMGKFLFGTLSLDLSYDLEQRLFLEVNCVDGQWQLSWEEIGDAETFRVYQSSGSGEMEVLNEVSETQYSIDYIPSGETVYFQVVAQLEDGDIYSNRAMAIAGKDGSVFADSDCDLLNNYLEAAFGTLASLEDSDGDGLSDYFEVANSMTSPTAFDSDLSGVSDGSKDFDGDGLTNLEEFRLGSSPRSADSDDDGLTDDQEVALGIDPNAQDTDGDGLRDDAEYLLGLDPLNPSTNGSEKDAKATHQVHVKVPNTDGALDLTDKGSALSSVRVNNITDNTTLKDDPNVVSPVLSVETAESTTGTVTLPITGGGTDVAVAVYDPEFNQFRLLDDSQVSTDGKSVTAPLSQSGEVVQVTNPQGKRATVKRNFYCAIAIPNWRMEFGNPLSPNRKSDLKGFDVEFVVDESGSMEVDAKNDKDRYRVSAVKRFTYGLQEGDRAGIIGFASDADIKISLTGDMEDVRDAADEIGSKGSTKIYTGLELAVEKLVDSYDVNRGRFIILLTDGKDSGNHASKYDEIIKTCQEKKIPIYCIGLGTSVDTTQLRRLSSLTGGSFIQISSAEDLPLVFNRVSSTAFYGEDTDADGLPDAVEEHGLRDGRGFTYKTDPQKTYTDDDDLNDGVEAGNVYSYTDGDGKTVSYFLMHSDPTRGDTDGDGIDDYDELLMGTLTWDADTDNDGLNDGLEVSIGYNPFHANQDGDSFTDKEEYESELNYSDMYEHIRSSDPGDADIVLATVLLSMEAKDPFTYDLTSWQKFTAFMNGMSLGDYGDILVEVGSLNPYERNSIYYFFGQKVSESLIGVKQYVAIRDAILDLFKGDYAKAFSRITGLFDSTKAIGKAVEFVDFSWKALAGQGDTFEFMNKVEVHDITAAPAYTYTLLYAMVRIEKGLKTDMKTSSVMKLINNQVENGCQGMTKDTQLNWLAFLELAEDDLGIEAYSTTESVKDYKEMDLEVTDREFPVNLIKAARTHWNSKPGGLQEGEQYTLTRIMDLSAYPFQDPQMLEGAIDSQIELTASYMAGDDTMNRTLYLMISDSLISKKSVQILNSAVKDADKKGVELILVIYTATE